MCCRACYAQPGVRQEVQHYKTLAIEGTRTIYAVLLLLPCVQGLVVPTASAAPGTHGAQEAAALPASHAASD
jgi:hypothetical protein